MQRFIVLVQFEIKKILKSVCAGGTCPPETMAILRELEDAHR